MSSMVHADKQVIFCHVPKNAGTSMSAALKASGGFVYPRYGPVEDDVEMGWKLGECQRVRSHIGRALWDACFRFAFVRNPWDRLVSSWEFTRQRNKHELSFERFVREPLSLDFGQEREALRNAIWTHWHTMPQTDHLTIDGTTAVHFVGRMERLEADWQDLCARLGIPVKLPRTNTTVRREYRRYYNDTLIDIVHERFRRDIETFGYEF